MFNHTRIVLVNTTHPGNIGAAARAMKTMGLTRLYLVAPEKFPHSKADEMAVSAVDVLQQAIVVPNLLDAIADCQIVVGTSARGRTIPWPMLTPREMAEKLTETPEPTEIAILFGQEQSGLTNDELHACHWHVQIPTNPDYSSLNLAAAVQIITYEWRMAALRVQEKNAASQTKSDDWDYRLVTMDEMEKLYAHLERVLIMIDFLKPSAPRQLMTRLRRFFNRTHLDAMEMNIWRGMLKAVEESVKSNDQPIDVSSSDKT